jgi:hypothetical protein
MQGVGSSTCCYVCPRLDLRFEIDLRDQLGASGLHFNCEGTLAYHTSSKHPLFAIIHPSESENKQFVGHVSCHFFGR